ncbi:MAG: phosphonate ABC transporter, permease protein PhnE [Chloroflexi bacterium]|nr:phosphonate ABC transporter, permease protein PhnE [Chloroflexota bacterium]
MTPAIASLDLPLLAPPKPASRLWVRWIIGAAAAAILGWAYSGAAFSPVELIEGWPSMADLLSKMLPPSTAILPALWQPIVITIQMALVGTSLAAVLAIPLGVLGARNVTPYQSVRRVVRLLLNALRTVPELVYALLFIAAVGLGPFAGVMALLLNSMGFLGKVYSEALEAVDPRPLEALRGVGASAPQAAWYAVVPQALPIMASYVLYNFEVNFRAATILGLVGAGGIGFELQLAISLFHFHDMFTIVLLIGICVVVLDTISGLLRRRLV